MEILAPAGDLESLELALYYGADAIYVGGKIGSLRADSSAFSNEDLKKAIELCHKQEKKLYLALNIIPHNNDLIEIEKFLSEISDYKIDAFIISDFGIKKLIEKYFETPSFHLSTQANITNYMTADFYRESNFERIVLARELSFSEIEEFIKNTKNTEYEIFIHGAMCLSYSGRCYLSSYLSNRDGNRGECSQPCRWKYAITEKKNGENFPVFEDERGSYLLNSKDLCLLPYLQKIIESKIVSVKIEGRMKSAYYIASVVRAYKNAKDEYEKNGKINTEYWMDELRKTSHRDFTSGFFDSTQNKMFTDSAETMQKTDTSTYINNYDFLAKVLDYDKKKELVLIESRNKFEIGEEIEIFGKTGFKKMKIKKLYDDKMNSIAFSNTPMREIYINMPFEVEKNMMIRRKNENN